MGDVWEGGFKLASAKSAQASYLVALLCLMEITGSPLAVALLVSPGQPAYAQGTSSSVINLNNEGVNALNKGNYALAIQKLEEAVRQDPTYEMARSNLSIAYNNYGLSQQGNPSQAIKMFHKALILDAKNVTTQHNLEGIIRMMSRDPNNFKDRVDLGDAARKSGDDFAGAIVEYKAALALKDDAPTHEKLGDVLRVQGKIDQAVTEYQAATRSQDSAGLEVKIGQAFQAKKDVASAIKAYARALTLNPNDSDVLDALVAGWDAAIKANPTAPENHIGMGQALQYRGDFAQAQEEYKQAIRFSRGNNPIAQDLLAKLPLVMKKAEVDKHINLGVDLQAKNLYDQAIEEYKLALQADPNNAVIYVNMGSAYQAKKDYDNAMDCYQKGLRIDPQNKGAMEGLQTCNKHKEEQRIVTLNKEADSLFKAGKFDEALARFQELLKKDQNDPAIHFNIGAALEGKKDLDGAIDEYRLAVKLDPKSKAYADALSSALDDKVAPVIKQALAAHQAKNYTEAINLYNQALAIRPDSPDNDELWYNMGAAQYSKEDYRAAQLSYEKAYKLDPKGRVDDLYYIGTILEHYGNGGDAVASYKNYLAQAPGGSNAAAAKARVAALSKNITDTIKIKSESQLATEKDAADAYNAAVKLQESKQFDQAIAKYQEAIAKNDKEVDYVYSLGTAYQAKDDYDNAMLWYQKAKAMDPKADYIDKAMASVYQDQAGPLVEQAVAKQTAGDMKAAIGLYQQAVKLVPNNARVWTNLGICFQETDAFDQARNAYQKAYDLDSKNEIGNLYLLGAIDENSGQGAKAKGEYATYVQKAPGGQYYQLAKARLDALTKNANDTQKLASSSDRANSASATTAYEAGVNAQKASDFDEAIKQYTAASKAMPKEPAYAYALGTAYQGKGDYDNAVASYKQALAISNNAQLTEQVKNAMESAIGQKVAPLIDDANKAYGAADYQTAAAKYQEALAIQPNNADAYTFLAASYQFMGNFAQARQAYDNGFRIGGKAKADNLYFLGMLDETDGNGAKAITTYQRYLQNAPTGQYKAAAQGRIDALKANVNAVQKIQTKAEQEKSASMQQAYTDAVNLQQAGKYDEAEKKYQEGIAAAPNEPSLYYGLGTNYQAKGDMENALKNYEKAVALAPGEKTYIDTLRDAKLAVNQAKAAPLLESAYKKQTATPPDYPGAIADYLGALRIADDPGTHFNLGTAYQGKGDNTQALQEYSKAIQGDGKNADYYYYRATVYEALQQLPAAKGDYAKYLQLAPTGQNAADAKERIKLLGGAATTKPPVRRR